MNYKEVVDEILEACREQDMIADVGYGQLSDIKVLDENDDGADYPYAFLVPAGITRTEQSVTYSFNLIVMEMALNARAVLEVQSNCLQYLDDIIANLRFARPYLRKQDVQLNQSTQVFRERFQDEVAGATATLDMVVAKPIDFCDAPFTWIKTSSGFASATGAHPYGSAVTTGLQVTPNETPEEKFQLAPLLYYSRAQGASGMTSSEYYLELQIEYLIQTCSIDLGQDAVFALGKIEGDDFGTNNWLETLETWSIERYQIGDQNTQAYTTGVYSLEAGERLAVSIGIPGAPGYQNCSYGTNGGPFKVIKPLQDSNTYYRLFGR